LVPDKHPDNAVQLLGPIRRVRSLHATTFQGGALTAAGTAAYLLVNLPAAPGLNFLTVRHLAARFALRASPGRAATTVLFFAKAADESPFTTSACGMLPSVMRSSRSAPTAPGR
jgi:hypothetical protein